MIGYSPSSRNPDTAMRELLRQLDRRTNYIPARPNITAATTAAAAAPPVQASPVIGPTNVVLRIGGWVLSENADGELVATHDSGTVRVLATPEAQ